MAPPATAPPDQAAPAGWPGSESPPAGRELPPPIDPEVLAALDRQRGRSRLAPPRVSARALLGGLGLLSILVTVAILGLLGSRVLSGLDDADADAERTDLLDRIAGSDRTVASTVAPTDHSAVALRQRCEQEQRIVMTAVRAYQATHGALPPDLDALVGDFLAAPVDTVSYRVHGAEVVVDGAGECATG